MARAVQTISYTFTRHLQGTFSGTFHPSSWQRVVVEELILKWRFKNQKHRVSASTRPLFFPDHCLPCNLHSLAFSPLSSSTSIISDNVLEITASSPAGAHTFVITCQQGLGIVLLRLAKKKKKKKTADVCVRLCGGGGQTHLEFLKRINIISAVVGLCSSYQGLFFCVPRLSRTSSTWWTFSDSLTKVQNPGQTLVHAAPVSVSCNQPVAPHAGGSHWLLMRWLRW